MAADVVKGAEFPVGAPDDDHRGAGGVDVLREVAPAPRGLLDPSDVQPGPSENGLLFEVIDAGEMESS